MEIKKHATGQSMGQRTNQKGNLKNTLKQMKMEIQQQFMEYSKTSSKKEVHSNKCLPQDTRKISNKQHNP